MTLLWQRFLSYKNQSIDLIFRANQWTGFYMIGTCVTNKLNGFVRVLWPLFMDGVQLSQGCRATMRRQFNFLPFSSQEFLVLNWSTSEGWKVELNFEPLSERHKPSKLNFHKKFVMTLEFPKVSLTIREKWCPLEVFRSIFPEWIESNSLLK